ncbi:MAG: nidogen-like domain-containing protein [Phycisphaerales bacterium]
MKKIHVLAVLGAAGLASTALGQMFYPLNSADPTGPGPGGGWSIVHFDGAVGPDYRNDDLSSPLITLPDGFDYCFYGVERSSLYVNNNGNITFGGPFGTFTPAGFPVTTAMVAPFWADVDTRNAVVGTRPTNLVYSQMFLNGPGPADDVFVISWDNVGYFGVHNDLRNTFQVAIANDEDYFGPGFNTLFSYDLMEWTTGDASGGVGGFGGAPATVGINEGTSALNRFDEWGRYDTAAEVASLNHAVLVFNGCEGIVPTPAAAALLGLGGLVGMRRRRA